MSLPTFRFVDAGVTPCLDDEEFWRDVDASDRLESAIKANLYLRELCRTKAAEDTRLDAIRDRDEREQALLGAVFSRGYRLFGCDLSGARVRQPQTMPA